MVETISRNIRYYGRLILPNSALQSKILSIDFNLIRGAISEYRNFIYRPESKSNFGIVLLMKDEYVLQEITLAFNNQRIFSSFNDAAFLGRMLLCLEKTIRNDLVVVCNALGGGCFPLPSTLQVYKHREIDFNIVQVCLREEQMLAKITASWVDIERCNDEELEPPEYSPPPPPPPRPEPFPGTTPDPETDFTPDPPYDEPNDGGGTYNPNPEPPPPDFPLGEECQGIRVTGTHSWIPQGESNRLSLTFEVIVFGTILGQEVVSSQSTVGSDSGVFLDGRGRADQGTPCAPVPFPFKIVDPASNFIEGGSYQLDAIFYELL